MRLNEFEDNFTPEQLEVMSRMIRQWNSGSNAGRYPGEVEEELHRLGYTGPIVRRMQGYIRSISHHGK